MPTLAEIDQTLAKFDQSWSILDKICGPCWPNIDHIRRNMRRIWLSAGNFRPNSPKPWPQSGPIQPMVVNLGRCLVNFGQCRQTHRPNLGRISAPAATLRSAWTAYLRGRIRAELGARRPEVGRIGPTLARFRSRFDESQRKLAGLRPSRSKSGQCLSKASQSRSAQIDPNCRIWSNAGNFGPNSPEAWPKSGPDKQILAQHRQTHPIGYET